jgi:nucleotide-binding universal stress UspA family protein
MKRILVAYDDTDSARRALERAVELAKAFDAEVIVASVAPLLVSSPRSSGPVDPIDSPERHAEELDTARALLSEHGIDATTVAATGDPAGAIAMIADEKDADLVVVGTREPGFAERVLRHSVSAEVARRVHRDLLIVHPAH